MNSFCTLSLLIAFSTFFRVCALGTSSDLLRFSSLDATLLMLPTCWDVSSSKGGGDASCSVSMTGTISLVNHSRSDNIAGQR